jgi:hypothetical protein
MIAGSFEQVKQTKTAGEFPQVRVPKPAGPGDSGSFQAPLCTLTIKQGKERMEVCQ